MYRTATNAERSRPTTKHPRPIPTTAPVNNRTMTLFEFHQTKTVQYSEYSEKNA